MVKKDIPTQSSLVKKNTSPTAVMDKPKETESEKTSKPNYIKSNVTKIIIIYDVGFGNTLFIRGQGAGLNWNKGIPLKNIKTNEWIYESSETCALAEFKVLINDHLYETGPNHSVKCGSTVQYTPKF